MKARIEQIGEKKLVGQHLRMNMAENRTFELWRSFMPRRKEITNNLNSDLISLQVYDSADFSSFSMETAFEKWALVEVSDFGSIPDGMERFVLPGGLYAVFLYKGLPGAFGPTFQYIIHTWLPESGYAPDDRPHFEVLGEQYKRDSPESEEEVWIPVKMRK
jgi:AraC family transcriptional regulator